MKFSISKLTFLVLFFVGTDGFADGQPIPSLEIRDGQTMVFDNQEIGGYPVKKYRGEATRELISLRHGTLILRNSKIGGIEGNSVRCLRVSNPLGPCTLVVDNCTFYHCRAWGKTPNFDADHIVVQDSGKFPVTIRITNCTFILDGNERLRTKRAIKIQGYDNAVIKSNQFFSSSPDANCAIHLSDSKGHAVTNNLIQGVYRDFICSAVDGMFVLSNTVYNEKRNVDFLECKDPELKNFRAADNRLRGMMRNKLRLQPGARKINVITDFNRTPTPNRAGNQIR